MKKIICIFVVLLLGFSAAGFILKSPDYMKYKNKTYSIKTSLLQGKLTDKDNNPIYLDSKNIYTEMMVNNTFIGYDVKKKRNTGKDTFFVYINGEDYFISADIILLAEKEGILKLIPDKNVKDPIPIKQANQSQQINWDNTKKALIKSKIVFKEAQDNGTYNLKEAISINKSIFVAVEWTRAAYDQYSNGSKYYFVVDFSILNVSNKNYYSLLSDFTLEDALGYTYNPDIIFDGNGDIQGKVNAYGNSRRGEIAFEVSPTQSEFILHYSTKAGFNLLKALSSTSETINFKLNIKH